MWDREDSQEVGLEAAILERVRNSSLVEWFCADNVVGLKYTAEAAATAFGPLGRRAFRPGAKRRREPVVDRAEVRMQA